MLQRIRERTQGWIAAVIFSLVAITFVFFGLQYYLTGNDGARKVLAKVNGHAITQKLVDQAFQQALRERRRSGARSPLAADQRRHLKAMVLERLIQTQVMEDGLAEAGFLVSLEAAQQLIVHLPQFQEKGQFSPKRFSELLYMMHLSQPSFFQRLRFQMMQQQASEGFVSTAFLLPYERARASELMGQTRDVGYFRLTQHDLEKPVGVSDKEIKEFYHANQASFKAPEQVSLSYVVLSPERLSKQVNVSESALKAYYLAHSDQFKKRPYLSARAQVRRVLMHQKVQSLLARQSQQLTELAYTHSDSLEPAAKALGLKIKTTVLFPRTGASKGLAADPRIAAEAFSREVLRDKSNSRPISQKDGSLVVMRLNQHKPEHIMPLQRWRRNITRKLQRQKTQRALGLLAYHVQSAYKNLSDIPNIEKRFHLHWAVSKGVRVDSQQLDPAFRAQVFIAPLHKMESVAVKGGEYRVFSVLSVKLGKPDTAKQKNQMEKVHSALTHFMGSTAYQYFVQSLQDSAKIKRN